VPPEPELAVPELVLVPPELVLVPPELVLVPPELVLVPPELVITTPELELVPLEPAVALPEFEFVPVLAPLDPELPFVVPPSYEAPGEVSLEPLEQPPTAATAIVAAPARDAARATKPTEREKRLLVFATLTHKT
jgi:hypothetical protein